MGLYDCQAREIALGTDPAAPACPSPVSGLGFGGVVAAVMVAILGTKVAAWAGRKLWEKCVVAIQEFPYSKPPVRHEPREAQEEVELELINLQA